MNYELQRQDILRNLIPGFIFFLVLFTLGGCDFSIFQEKLKGIDIIFLLTVFAFVIGTLSQTIYRLLHVITIGDQLHWEEWEGKTLLQVLGHQYSPKILDMFNNIPGFTYRPGRILSSLLELYFIQNKEEDYRAKSHNLVSPIHSLGASAVSIAVAIFFGSIINTSLFFFFFWVLIATVLLKVRKDYLHNHYTISQHFIIQNIDHIKNFIDNGHLKNEPPYQQKGNDLFFPF